MKAAISRSAWTRSAALTRRAAYSLAVRSIMAPQRAIVAFVHYFT
jgi:hypothetical protein